MLKLSYTAQLRAYIELEPRKHSTIKSCNTSTRLIFASYPQTLVKLDETNCICDAQDKKQKRYTVVCNCN